MRPALLIASALLAFNCVQARAADGESSALPAATTDPGADLYAYHCGACHDEGDGHPGTMRLGLRSGAAQAVLLERNDLTADYVKTVVRQGLQMMPPFRPTEISAGELDALAAYITTRNQEP